jgi:hypothetical protein
MALYGPPRANEMGKPSRGRGGAAHAGGARGVSPRSNPSYSGRSSARAMRSPSPHFHGRPFGTAEDRLREAIPEQRVVDHRWDVLCIINRIPEIASLCSHEMMRSWPPPRLLRIALRCSAPPQKKRNLGGTPPMPPVSFCTSLRRCSGHAPQRWMEPGNPSRHFHLVRGARQGHVFFGHPLWPSAA